jgi:RNA polymerase sigma-70 factor (TIGR02943 family)
VNPESGHKVIDSLMEHAPALYGFAFARVRDHHLAEDLVQDSLVVGWKSWENYQGGSSLLTWLIGILRHKILDHHRASSRRPVVSIEDNDGGQHSTDALFNANGDWTIDPNHGMQSLMQSPAKAAQNSDLRKWIVFCMEKLPARLHLLFAAREVDEMSVADAARLAGVTEGSAAVMLTRARHALRLCLQESLNR